MKQSSIFDQIERKKQEGIEVSYRNADSYWKQEAAAMLRIVAKRQQYLTSDDILIPLEERGIVTGNNSAMGAIFQAAARMGLIVSTDTFMRCRRPSRHGAPIMRWKSNLYREPRDRGDV